MISNCKWCHKSEDQICKIFTADVQLCPNYIQDGIVNSEKAYIYIYILLWLLFMPFFIMKKVNGFSITMIKISGLVKENQLKNKYITNKIEKV